MTPRIARSFLAVPGANADLFPKAARSGADQVFLDLEDAVAPAERAAARHTVIDGVATTAWPESMTVTVRVNAPQSPEFVDDIREVVGGAGPRLSTILVPKIESAAEVERAAALVEEAERAAGLTRTIGLEVLIESAPAFLSCGAIASASDRLEALHFGAGDFAASMGARTLAIGRLGAGGADPWHPVKLTMVAAARANGLRCLDSAYDDFRDEDGYREVATTAAALGFDGKWAIHPAQVPIANEVFTPTAAEVARATRIVEAMDAAAAAGRGAAQIDGVMIDAASLRLARRTLEVAERASG